MHLPRDADRRDARVAAAARAPMRIDASVACHHASGSCSAHPGCGVAIVSGDVADATTSPLGRDENRLDAARADVESEEERLASRHRTPSSSSIVSWSSRSYA